MSEPSRGGAASGGARPCRLALLAALPLEVRPFLRRVKARRLQGLGLPAWEFSPGEGRGVLALTGMGEEAAGEAAKRVVALWQPQVLISLGFSGALLPGLAPGDLVLGGAFHRYDPADGRLDEVQAPAPPRPLEALAGYLTAAGLPAAIGSCVTTPCILHKGSQGGALQQLPQPALDLETAALAALALEAGIPFLALRVITDTGGEEIPDFIREGWEPGYGPGLPKVLCWLAGDPRRLKAMLHLWRRSRLGAARLAEGLGVILPLC